MLLGGWAQGCHQEESNIKKAYERSVTSVENSSFLAMYSALGGSWQHGPM